MNTYEIRITNTTDDNDLATIIAKASDPQSLAQFCSEAIHSNAEVAFQHGDRYIVIFEASDEGYMYDIYGSQDDYINDRDSLDGGQCTSTLSNAIEMALSQA